MKLAQYSARTGNAADEPVIQTAQCLEPVAAGNGPLWTSIGETDETCEWKSYESPRRQLFNAWRAIPLDYSVDIWLDVVEPINTWRPSRLVSSLFRLALLNLFRFNIPVELTTAAIFKRLLRQ